MHRLLSAVILLALLPCAGQAAEMEGTVRHSLEGERTVVRVSGVITPDVAADFIDALDATPASRPVVVELDSPGGYVKAGFAMVDAMLRARSAGRSITTQVRAEASCESMCFGVYMAGFPRRAEAGATFMVHAPRDERSGALSLRTTNEMIARLIGLGTAPAWIHAVAERGGFSGRMDFVVRAEELARSGANVVTELAALH
ncbi:ATP-dependent Clp protease proteolytic subunit [Azospirillum sp.]|uniref:ATP-dependent Clp protease proteolytic subunit n=1 Tax=Azospirillum sp. TaxID=34012 RepID=UPI003D7591E6